MQIQNFKGQLFEICQKLDLVVPTYKTVQDGPPHKPEFTTTCTLHISDQAITVVGYATSKQKSHHEASKLILVQLAQKENFGEQVLIETSKFTFEDLVNHFETNGQTKKGKDEDAIIINGLRSFCREHKYGDPRFTCPRRDSVVDPIGAICTISPSPQKTLVTSGKSNSRKSAQALAALKMMKLLKETFKK